MTLYYIRMNQILAGLPNGHGAHSYVGRGLYAMQVSFTNIVNRMRKYLLLNA